MYSWDLIQPELDSTLRLIHESINRGHKVSIIYPNEMAIRRTIVWGNCHVIENKDAISKDLQEFYNSTTFTEELSPLKEQDVIFLRDNPPLDNHLLNFLDTLENDTIFINSISGLRKANNKIYPATLAALHDNENEDTGGNINGYGDYYSVSISKSYGKFDFTLAQTGMDYDDATKEDEDNVVFTVGTSF